MLILGLTGSIGMGKSTAGREFRRAGVPVFDADAAVHRALARGGAAVALVEAAFPGVTRDGAVDRSALAARVFGDPDALARLEAILHPLAADEQRRFLMRQAIRRAPVVVLDVPLLFETGAAARYDAVVVVSAPAFLQRQRVLRRPGMTAERLGAILNRQTPDVEKRQRAWFVVQTGLGRAFSARRIRAIVAEVSGWRGRIWAPLRHRR